MQKKIRGSKRGLTFSFVVDGEQFAPGTHYRYIVDKTNCKITIVPSKNGGNTVSKKKSGAHIKSLIDLRGKDVLDIVSTAEYLDIEFTDDCILVAAVDGTEKESVSKITYLQLAPELLMAVGAENFVTENIVKQIPNEYPWDKSKLQKQIPKVLKVISLFSGAGMLDYEFSKDPRFEIVYAAEYMHDAVETYRYNIGDHIEECDIRNLHGKDLPKADIIIGGPPCQPFSNANRHGNARGELHPEGDMFIHYLRLVRECNVKAFLIENVPGLLSSKMGYYIDLMREKLPDFHIAKKVITDCDLGGFTKRKRAIIIGCKSNIPNIPNLKIMPARTAGSAMVDVNEEWPNFRDVTVSSELVKRKISMIPEGGNWQDLPREYWTKSVHSNMYRRIDRNKPSVSIANWRKFLLSPPKWTNSDTWDRILSVSEAAALQGLDKHFKFLGSLSAKQQMVANGVTAAIARFCKNILANLFYPCAVANI